VVARLAAASCFFLILAVVRTFPLIASAWHHIPMDPGDPLLNTWILSWGTHALTTNPIRLFDANIFYPVQNSLALSEHLLGVQPIFASTYALTGNPLLSYNAVFLLSFALSGIAAFWLAYHFTDAFWPSLAAGTLFGFAPLRLEQLSHLQLLNSFWAPGAIVFLDRFLCSRRWRDLAGLAVFCWLQVLSSVYLGYMISGVLILCVAYHALVVDRSLLRLPVLTRAAVFLVASLAVLVPVHLPYVEVHRSWQFTRSLSELTALSPDFFSYLAPPQLMNDLYSLVLKFREPVNSGEKRLFPGLVLPVLALLGSFGGVGKVPADRVRRVRRMSWLIMGAGWLISLGPYLSVLGHDTRVPLPYLLLYRVVPGFASMRVPGRFALLVVLAAVPLAALGALRCGEKIAKWFSPDARWQHLAAPVTSVVLISLFLFELGWKPLPLVPIPVGPEIPPVYHWLAAERPGPVLELPFGPDMNPAWTRENHGLLNDERYVYFSTVHWQPLVNGASGFTPPTYDEMREALRNLPSPPAIQYATAAGLRAIVVHTDRLPPEESERWKGTTAPGGLKLVAVFGSDRVYALPPALDISPLQAETAVPSPVNARKPVRAGLLLQADGVRPWAHPRPHGVSLATVRWTDVDTGRRRETLVRVRLPLVVLQGDIFTAAFDLRAPAKPGRYSLQVLIPSVGVMTQPRVVKVANAVPTSQDSPRLLGATYRYEGRSPALAVPGSGPFRLDVAAVNTGQALWLSRARDDKGTVVLGWRWFRDGRELPEFSGRTRIPYDTSPGQACRFQPAITPPPRRGIYGLELDLVSEHLTWFADVGAAPLRLTVEVRDTPAPDFRTVLEQLRVQRSKAPRSTLSVERASDVYRFTGRWQTREGSKGLDIYLVFQQLGGGLWFYDGRRLVPRTGMWWTPWALGSSMPTNEDVPLASVRSPELPPGRYRAYLVSTEPDSYRVIASAETSFEVMP
jgi:hypothetical protein